MKLKTKAGILRPAETESNIATYTGRREVSAEKFIKEMSFIKRRAG